ncbi:hypothetical protein [Xanthomonas translucens]|uniref:hypothetical protein n=1 Tax=Xanthomonas campestris pv. translucens TaxID=343 RepID=UPI000B0C4EF4|nr:hypothetical protein [Xanthomonas translucens]
MPRYREIIALYKNFAGMQLSLRVSVRAIAAVALARDVVAAAPRLRGGGGELPGAGPRALRGGRIDAWSTFSVRGA